MKVLGIIPARGGSKGVPRKNIKSLAGKPLIAYSIEAARSSRTVSAFTVSTDDEEIAAISREYGATVLERPAEFARDTSGMPEVIRHALNAQPSAFDVILLLQPTCPQRTSQDIDLAIELLVKERAKSVISVYQVEDHHPARMYGLEGGRLRPLFPKLIATRRQELPPVYHRNGAIYACLVSHFNQTGALWDDHPAPYVMPRERSLNIDDPFDFSLAEFIFSKLQE